MKSKPQTVTGCQHPYNGSIFHSPVSLSIVITVIVCLCLGYFVFQVTALEKGKVYERTCVCVCVVVCPSGTLKFMESVILQRVGRMLQTTCEDFRATSASGMFFLPDINK